MRLDAALQGDLEAYMHEELATAEQAVTSGIREEASNLKDALRADVIQGGLGRRLSKSWRAEVYPKHGASLGAAALVYTKAPKLIDAFDKGTTIRSAEGFWLAIPTPSAPRFGTDRKRINPSNFPEARLGKLRFVYRDGKSGLLVVDNQRLRKGKRPGYTLSRSKKALSTGEGLSTVPMFFLVPQTRLKKRLRVREISDTSSLGIATEIDRAFMRLSRRRS